MSRTALIRALGVFALIAGFALPGTARAAAWMWDQNQNRIDDRIEQVESQGLTAAHLGNVLSGRLRFAVFSSLAPFEYGVYIGYGHAPTDADAAALQAIGVPVEVRYRSIPYIRSRISYIQALQIAALPGVWRIETIPILYPVNDIASRILRARDSEGALHPSVWKHIGVTGRGVSVAILDTGVNDEADPLSGYPGHESLRGKFLGGGNFFSGQAALNTPIDASENPKHTIDPEATYHGSHVAGSAIGSGGPQGVLGGGTPGFYAGMAPDARLIDLKVLSDAGLGFGAADALEWLIAHRFDTWGLTGADTIYRGVDVANMSIGGTDNSDGTDASCAAVNAATLAGIVVCVASGNDGNTNWIASPAAADLAITVGSFTDNNTIPRADDFVSDYSNEGPRLSDGDGDVRDEMKPSVLGPGTGILSVLGDPTTAGDQYHHINGTSMATPCVAGIAALVLSAHPQLTPQQVRRILEDTSDHRTDMGKQPPSAADPFNVDPNYHPSWGWGEVDGYAAVKEALNPAATQVVRIAVTPQRGPDAVRIDWWSQREVGLTSYTVDRAADVSGAPGAWTTVTTVPVANPAAEIHEVANRHAYSFTDTDASLDPTATYWYRVRFTDDENRTFSEPALKVRIQDSPVLARVRFSWTHNYSDGDLAVKFGTGTSTTRPVWFRAAPGAPAADSVITRNGVAFTGTLQHYFHIDLTAEDGVASYLPPSAGNPWYLGVKEGGFVNTKGTVNDFSVTVFGPSGNTTYSAPNPATTTIEKQETVFWVPLDPGTSTNHNPVLDPIGPQSIGEGLTRTFTLSAIDADGQTLAYSASGLPAGATFDAGTRQFSWTPGYSSAGSYTATFTVSDQAFPVPASDTEVVEFTVTERNPGDNASPVLDALHDRDAFVGERISFRITGRDPEGSPLTFSSSTLLAGASLNPAAGTFEWIPNDHQQGRHRMEFTATDANGASSTSAMYVSVRHPGYDPEPPSACTATASDYSGVVGAGTDPGEKDIQYRPFTIAQGTQRIEGTLTWFGGPVVDLDFYLIDADSNVVGSAASSDPTEHLVVMSPAPGNYMWKVVAFTNPDTAEFTIDQESCVTQTLAVGDAETSRLSLSAGTPNPFRTTNAIRFAMPQPGHARLAIFDLAGRRVRTLHDGWAATGSHTKVWDRRTDRGSIAQSGVYFYRLEAAGQVLGRKVVMVK